MRSTPGLPWVLALVLLAPPASPAPPSAASSFIARYKAQQLKLLGRSDVLAAAPPVQEGLPPPMPPAALPPVGQSAAPARAGADHRTRRGAGAGALTRERAWQARGRPNVLGHSGVMSMMGSARAEMRNIPVLRAEVAALAAQAAFKKQVAREQSAKRFKHSWAAVCRKGQHKLEYRGWEAKLEWKCVDCERGRAMPKRKASKSCRACEPGRFARFMGSINCRDCPAGKYQSLSEQLSCFGCPQGKWTKYTAQRSCPVTTWGKHALPRALPFATRAPTPQPTLPPLPRPKFRATSSHVHVGRGAHTVCGRLTQASTTGWKMSGEFDGVVAHVDTSFCSFTAATQYVASAVGDMRHFEELGTLSLQRVSAKGFELHMLHPSMHGEVLLAAAKEFGWRISWIGGDGSNTGLTVKGNSGWRQLQASAANLGNAHETVLFLDVNTTACGFPTAPRYFTALRGVDSSKSGWRAEGSHIVYAPSATGFRVYITYQMRITPQQAEQKGWSLSFIGTPRGAGTAAYWQSGTAKPSWKMNAAGSALVMSVSTQPSGFIKQPAYVAAIEVPVDEGDVVTGGSSSLFRVSKSGFELTLDRGHHRLHSDYAQAHNWSVSYIGYDGPWPFNCEVGPWTRFTGCSRKCGGGTYNQTRVVKKQAMLGGIACPALQRTAPCNTAPCAKVDCKLSQWSAWSACDRKCSWGKHVGAHARHRKVLVKPQHGGTACDPAQEKQECNMQLCSAKNCVVSAWASWTKCSVTCGGGRHTRTRKVLHKPMFRGSPCGSLWQKQQCGTKVCPAVDCKAGKWSSWGDCSKSCGIGDGSGAQARTRQIVQPALRGGKACPTLTDSRACNLLPCPVDCILSPMTGWGKCASDWAADGMCGNSTQTRGRRIVVAEANGGVKCPHRNFISRPCQQARSCMGSGASNMCGHVSTVRSAEWRVLGAHGIGVHVDTSKCGFKKTPQYFMNLVGDSSDAFFGLLTPAATVTVATRTGFMVHLWYPFLKVRCVLARPALLARRAPRHHRILCSPVAALGPSQALTCLPPPSNPPPLLHRRRCFSARPSSIAGKSTGWETTAAARA